MRKKIPTLFMIAITIYMIILLICYPKQMLDASAQGVNLWFLTVLPSLFPFMVGFGILVETGAARFLAKILSPFTKPLFHVSGYGAFAWVVGLFSGYPMGAKITSDLLEEGKINATEAQRLLSFTNNPGLLFILGTVSTGMFHNSSVGYFMIAVIFLSSLSVGIVFRFYHYHSSEGIKEKKQKKGNFYNTSIGALLGKNVRNSMDTITQIGGFIILFAVITKGLIVTGLSEKITDGMIAILPGNIPRQALSSLLLGCIEMTNGAALISQTALETADKIALCSAVLSFGGLSILFQTLSILDLEKIKIAPYFASKLLGGIFAYLFARGLYPFFERYLNEKAMVFLPLTPSSVKVPFFVSFAMVLFGFIIWKATHDAFLKKSKQ